MPNYMLVKSNISKHYYIYLGKAYIGYHYKSHELWGWVNDEYDTAFEPNTETIILE